MKEKITYKPENYPNLLDEIQLSSKEIEQEAKKIHVQFNKDDKDPYVEKSHLPLFISTFYNFIIKEKRIPTQEEYFNIYLEENRDQIQENILKYHFKGLKYRVYKTYPSLIRDIHFNKLVEENMTEYTVKFNKEIDSNHGADLILSKDDKYLGFCMYIDTLKGRQARDAKKERATFFSNVDYRDLAKKCTFDAGEISLYGNKTLNKVIEIAKEIL